MKSLKLLFLLFIIAFPGISMADVHSGTGDENNLKHLNYTQHNYTLEILANPTALPGEIKGYVKNADNNGIQNAKVTLKNVGEAFTDNDGFYSFTMVEPGTYTLIAYKEGYIVEKKDNILLNEDQVLELDFILKKPIPIITPAKLNTVLGPNQSKPYDINIQNLGDGEFKWLAFVEYQPEYISELAPFKAKKVEKKPSVKKSYKELDLSMAKSKGTPQSSPLDFKKYFKANNIYGISYFTKKFGYVNDEDMSVFTELSNMSEFTNNTVRAGDFSLQNHKILFLVDEIGNLFSQEIKNESVVTKFLKKLEFEKSISIITGLATDPTSGLLYLSTMEDLFVIDPYTFETEFIGSFGYYATIVLDITFDKTGKLYAADYNDNFLSVNKSNGIASIIGNTNFISGSHIGLAYDADSDKILMSCYDYNYYVPQLRVVDPETGASELVGNLPDDTYLFFIAMDYKALPQLWLTIDKWRGKTAADGGSTIIGAHFNTKDLVPGQFKKAKIHIVDRNIKNYQMVIPVTLEVTGKTLPELTFLEAELIDAANGVVKLNWGVKDDSNIDHYKIYINNEAKATTKYKQKEVVLEDYGIYSFKVSAVLGNGEESAPEGPVYISYLVPDICDSGDNIVSQTVFKDEFNYAYDTIKNCGDGLLSFNIEVNDMVTRGPIFITEVVPSKGTVAPHSEKIIRYKYSATDLAVGTYYNSVKIHNNTPAPYDQIIVEHDMNVVIPAKITGIVRDGNTNERIKGVKIFAAGPEKIFETYTDKGGEYKLHLEEGEYTILMEKFGYKPEFIYNYEVLAGEETIHNGFLYESPYAPGHVKAEVNTNDPADTECLVKWALPYGFYELLYDGDHADNYALAEMGNAFAVKYKPTGYPAKINGAKIYVGDGTFPENADFIGKAMKLSIYNEDENGLPGEVIDEATIEVTEFGWINAYDIFDVEIKEGNFFIAYTQVASGKNSAPIGVDESLPVSYQSYFFNTQKEKWEVSALQDLMIRAICFGPNDDNIITEDETKIVPSRLSKNITTFKKAEIYPGGIALAAKVNYSLDINNDTRKVVKYEIARLDVENPSSALTSASATVLKADVKELFFIDKNFKDLPKGYYAYKVRAIYTNGDISDWKYSNIVGHNTYCKLRVIVTTTTEESPVGTYVHFEGLTFPYKNYSATVTKENGILHFPKDTEHKWLYQGDYKLTADKAGFKKYKIDYPIEINTCDKTIEIVLQEKTYPVRNLFVNKLNSTAYWDFPLVTELKETFEKAIEPALPVDWKKSSNGVGWKYATEYVSYNWAVPEHDSRFIITNDDEAGEYNDASKDILETPNVDLRASDDFYLYFDSFFDGKYDGIAEVLYSTDNGENWNVLLKLKTSKKWENIGHSLADISGKNASVKTKFAFKFNDQGLYGSGWAIDNIEISNGAATPINYTVMLNDATQGETEELEWFFPNLEFGKIYTAGVAAHYTSGLSKVEYYTFKSGYLLPPRHLKGKTYEKSIVLEWKTPRYYIDGEFKGDIPDNLLGFNIYLKGEDDPIAFVEADGNNNYTFAKKMEPGKYSFFITAYYDLTPYGLPAETANSAKVGPVKTHLQYGYPLPFFEDWSSNLFETQNWYKGENWIMSEFVGTEAPSASFHFSPLLVNYKESLTSPAVNATTYEVGRIKLDFDLKLDKEVDSDEELVVSVGVEGNWKDIASFTSREIYDWKPISIDITPFAMKKSFRVRFTAKGSRSADIRAWYIDNILIDRVCEPAPFNLETKAVFYNDIPEDVGIKLNWEFPGLEPIIQKWVYYDNLTNNTGVGVGQDGNYSVAIKITPDLIENYTGNFFNKVRLFINEGAENAEIHIWKGENMDEIIYSEVVDNSLIKINGWSEIPLKQSIEIEDDATYYVGYTITAKKDSYPFGAYDNFNKLGVTDLISADGENYYSLSELTEGKLKVSWNIHIYISDEGEEVLLPLTSIKTKFNNEVNPDFINKNTSVTSINSVSNSRAKANFFIYRSEEGGEFIKIGETADITYLDPAYDDDENLKKGRYYEYYVKSHLKGIIDECLSEETNKSGETWSVGINEIETNALTVYPNPTDAKTFIESNENIIKIQVYNKLGKLFSVEDVNSMNYELDLDGTSPGIYMIQIETENEIIIKKITVM
ncbi:MAG: carboxypeptidase regulatory-like domain-containing protein [Bacteroidales bacterium]